VLLLLQLRQLPLLLLERMSKIANFSKTAPQRLPLFPMGKLKKDHDDVYNILSAGKVDEL